MDFVEPYYLDNELQESVENDRQLRRSKGLKRALEFAQCVSRFCRFSVVDDKATGLGRYLSNGYSEHDSLVKAYDSSVRIETNLSSELGFIRTELCFYRNNSSRSHYQLIVWFDVSSGKSFNACSSECLG